MSLPSPDLNGNVSLETAIQDRRSVRRYAPEPLDLADVSQLLWAAQGVTSESGGRAAPSAGGLYPLEVYAVVGEVRDLSPGVYRYVPDAHGLDHIGAEDERAELAAACLDQEWVEAAPVTLVITGVYSRTASKYGDRAERYVHLEAGHAGQNVYLQATALGLGTVCVGAFRDEEVQDALGIPDDETPLYVMPVGRPVD